MAYHYGIEVMIVGKIHMKSTTDVNRALCGLRNVDMVSNSTELQDKVTCNRCSKAIRAWKQAVS